MASCASPNALSVKQHGLVATSGRLRDLGRVAAA
jgi:hypothetical protein